MLPMRRTSKEPERSSLRQAVLHLTTEDVAYTASPSLTSDARPCQANSVLGPEASPHVWDPCSRSEMPNRWHAQLRSMMPASSRCQDLTPNTLRKCPVNQLPKPVEATPTQSPAQKTPKLKSVVQMALATKCYKELPYKTLKENPIEFVNYLMGTIGCKTYDAEIRSLSVFPMQESILTRHVIASIITAQVGANCGVHFMTPFIPAELMRSPPNPCELEVLGPPAQSKDYQLDICIKCVWEWMYLMHLLQYW